MDFVVVGAEREGTDESMRRTACPVAALDGRSLGAAASTLVRGAAACAGIGPRLRASRRVRKDSSIMRCEP